MRETQKPGIALLAGVLSASVIACYFLATIFVSSSLPSTNVDWWPMFHHDSSHTGYSNSDGPVTNQTLWIRETDNGGTHESVVFDNALYVCLGQNVYAIDAFNGAILWSHPASISGSPAVSNDLVYVCSGENVSALNIITGNPAWVYNSDSLEDAPHAISDPTGDVILTCPSVSDDVVYVTSGDGNAFGLNASTGRLLWAFHTADALTASPVLAEGVLYFSSLQKQSLTGVAYAINASTGEMIWAFGSSEYPFSSPTVAGGIVYMGSADRLYALNASNGANVWNYTVGIGASCPAVANGRLYVTSSGIAYALDAGTGTLLLTYNVAGHSLSGSIALAGDVLYVYGLSSLDGTGGIYAFNVTSGDLLWNYNGDLWWSSPIVAKGVVYASSNDAAGKGHVYAFSPSLSSQPLSSPTPSPTVPEFRHVAVLVLTAVTGLVAVALWWQCRFKSKSLGGKA